MCQVSNVQVRKTDMKSLLLLSLVLLNAGAAAQSPRDAPNQSRLVGAWKLVSLEEPSADGQVHKADCTGMFVFTRDGRASVQVMYRNAQTGSAYAQGGYEASYGSYRIDGSSTFTFHIDGALVRTLIGKDLKRQYEIRGNRLTVKSTDRNEHWKVVWERY
jgi:Lipocalin-like domain